MLTKCYYLPNLKNPVQVGILKFYRVSVSSPSNSSPCIVGYKMAVAKAKIIPPHEAWVRVGREIDYSNSVSSMRFAGLSDDADKDAINIYKLNWYLADHLLFFHDTPLICTEHFGG
jgi:hypothetical protein